MLFKIKPLCLIFKVAFTHCISFTLYQPAACCGFPSPEKVLAE